jgi:hypothetical protein
MKYEAKQRLFFCTVSLPKNCASLMHMLERNCAKEQSRRRLTISAGIGHAGGPVPHTHMP